MKKRFVKLIVAAAFAASLSACGTVKEGIPIPVDSESSEVSKVVSDSVSEASSEITESVPEQENENFVKPGKNQVDAKHVPFGKKLTSEIQDGNNWFSIKTDKDGSYAVTIISESNDNDVYMSLYDEDGNKLGDADAPSWGGPSTIQNDDLDPDTTYYFNISGDQNTKYTFYLTSPDKDYDPVKDLKKNPSDKPSKNPVRAGFATNGRHEDRIGETKNNWYAFRTGSMDGNECKLSVISTNGKDIWLHLYDKFGSEKANAQADGDGAAATADLSGLDPETVYYLDIAGNGSERSDYVLTVSGCDISSDDADSDEAETENNNGSGNADGNNEEAASGNITTASEAGTSQAYAPLIAIGNKVSHTFTKDQTNCWYAFKTTSDTDAVYSVTEVNTDYKRGSEIWANVYDEDGNKIGDMSAGGQGKASTCTLDKLDLDTMYYVKMSGEKYCSYTLLVRSSENKNSHFLTSDFSNPSQTSKDAGTNQTEATAIFLNMEVKAELRKDSLDWYVFTLDKAESCTISLSNLSGKDNVWLNIYDDYGNKVGDIDAGGDGKIQSWTNDELDPKQPYYLQVSGPERTQYVINVKAQEDTQASNLAFKKPFSLDETQVRFVINEATFADPNAAKDALKPVADTILKYPDHKILIAGTTATWGSQSYVQDLSNRRAEAVKKALVDDFKVPASQLVTKGLGYKDDPFERAADRDASGNFIESEAKKNRRVVIFDADSDIAKNILAK